MAHLDITPDQFTVMRTLLEKRWYYPTGTTHLMSSDPNTVASLLERMESAGLLSANRMKLIGGPTVSTCSRSESKNTSRPREWQ